MTFIITLMSALLWTPLLFTRKSFFNPIVYINFLIYFFFIAKYFTFIIFDIPFLKNTDIHLIEHSLVFFIGFVLFSYFLFIIFILLSKYNNNKKNLQNNTQNFSSNLAISKFYIPISLILLSIVSFLYFYKFSYFLEFRRFLESGGKFYLLAVISFFVFTTPILYLHFIWLNNFRNYLFNIFLFSTLILSFLFCIVSGFSSFIITFFLHPIYFYHIYFNKSIIYKLLFFIPLVCIYVILYSSFRENLFFYETDFYISDLSFLLEKIFNRFDYLEMMTLGLQYNLTNIDINLNHIYSFLVQFIPRSFWLDKPLNFSSLFTLYIQPNVFYESGSTANFNMFNEFIYIFGIFGFFIGPIIFSILLYLFYRSFQKSYLSSYHSLFYVLIMMHYLQAGFIGGYVNDLASPLLLINTLLFIIFFKKI